MKKVFFCVLFVSLMVNAIYGDDSKSDLNLDLNLIDNFYIYDGSLDYIPMRQITENYSSFYSIFNDLYFDSFSFNDNAFHDSLVLLPNMFVTYFYNESKLIIFEQSDNVEINNRYEDESIYFVKESER